jgi:DNA-binding NtrC family response regulator
MHTASTDGHVDASPAPGLRALLLAFELLRHEEGMADLLIVDDDLDVVWVLEQVLLGEGHVVRVAHNGEEGLKLLVERSPDLVILDVEMPILDGPSMAYQMFVHDCGMEEIPILLISGVFDVDVVAQRVGTPYFLSKPFDPNELLRLIRRTFTERALPRPAA